MYQWAKQRHVSKSPPPIQLSFILTQYDLIKNIYIFTLKNSKKMPVYATFPGKIMFCGELSSNFAELPFLRRGEITPGYLYLMVTQI